MAGRWRDPAAFRADPSAAPSARPSRRQALALLVVLVLVAGATAVASVLIRPDRARSFDLLRGSVYLSDIAAPVAVDLASGRPTVRLVGANLLVGLKTTNGVGVEPLDDGTLLIDPGTGTFNMVDSTGFVIKSNGGVPLPEKHRSIPVPDGTSAYIVQDTAPGTSVYLVDQSTVRRTATTTTATKARASVRMPDTAPLRGTETASADGDLWLLVGPEGRQTVRRLVVPADSSAGATLVASDRGVTTGPAAVGTAHTATRTVVGVASADRIQLFRGADDVATVTFPRVDGLTRILPVANASGRLSFLMLAGSSWKFLSVGADGTGLHGPSAMAVPTDTQVVNPAQSNGLIYTLDQSTGALYTVDRDGRVAPVRDMETYPTSSSDQLVDGQPAFADTVVYARASRVFVDSPTHKRAVVLFTDGSHAPLRILKQPAVDLKANGGALELAQNRGGNQEKPNTPPKSTAPGQPKPKPQPVQPVNSSINCKDDTRTPHTPINVTASPASRSAYVQWTYPITDNLDCYPSTYQVTVRQIGSSAPKPGNATVNDNTAANLTGLFPSTTYRISVTAYLNNHPGKPSPEMTVITTAEGPPAPKNVLASTDSAGNWSVTWSSCGTVQTGCVTAASWKVIPEFCDGRGVGSPPAPFSVAGDPTSVEQPPGVLHGGDALLGRGLRFQVEGVGDSAIAGRPSGYTACTYSWTPPVADDIQVTASTPPDTATSGDTSTTTVSVRLAKGPVHDLGGLGGSLTYELLDSSGSVVTTKGPTSSLSQTLGGVRPGEQFQVLVVVQPPRHPDAAVTIGPVDVRGAIAAFPVPTVSATFESTSYFEGRLLVSFDFPPGTDTRGETFDLVGSSLSCGSFQRDLSYSGASPGQTMVFDSPPVDRFNYNSMNAPCTVTIQLVQNQATSTNPPLYGAATSQSTSTPIIIPPPSLTADASNFSAQWSGSIGNPQVVVTYHGADRLILANSWTITVTNDGSTNCGASTNAPPATIDVSKACVRAGGNFTVSVDYNYILSHPHFDGIPVSGTAPQPVDTSKIDYTAAWNTDVTNPSVTVHYVGTEDASTFGTFSWTETVTSSVSPGVTCGSSTSPASRDVAIGIDLTQCPALAGDGTTKAVYSVEVTFHDPNYGIDFDKTYTVDGEPPA